MLFVDVSGASAAALAIACAIAIAAAVASTDLIFYVFDHIAAVARADVAVDSLAA